MTLQQQDGATQPKTILSKLRKSKDITVTGDSSAHNNPADKSNPQIENLAALMDLKKKNEMAAWVNHQYGSMKAARSAAERQWYLNLAFVNGKHYVSPINVPGQGFRLTAQKAPAWRVKMVVNKVRIAVRTEHAKLIQNKPIPTVIPSTGENEDFAAANVAEQLLKSEFATRRFDAVYRRWVWWGVVCGNSYIKQYWDKNYEDADATPPTSITSSNGKDPLVGQDGSPVRSPNKVKGKIMVEHVNPFHIYVPDLTSEDLNSQPFIMHVMTRSPQYVQNNYGFVPTCDAKESTTILEGAFMTATNDQTVLDSVLIKEVWLKPNAHANFPQGGLVTVINDRVVQYVEKWPWPFKEYPFYKYDSIKTGGFYSDSTIVDLIPLNKEYNRTKSQMLEIKNTMGKPKLMYQQGSINPRMISSEPGQAIPYKLGFEKPEVLSPVEIPATMGIELDRLTSDIDDISGQHEITRGNTPSQVSSGTAIAFLQEQDDTKLADPVSSIEHQIELLGIHYLKFVSNYWDEPRLVKVAGRDNAFEAKMWQGSDLKGNNDVIIQTGSALPFSKAAKQAMVTEFMQNGWIDPSSGMEILQMGSLQRVIDEALVDKKQAQRENLKLSKLNEQDLITFMTPPGNLVEGVDPHGNPAKIDPDTQEPWEPTSPIPVNSWDNHEAHIMFHDMYRKTQEFELLSDSHKQAMEMHVQTHHMAIQSKLEGQMGSRGPAPQTDENGNVIEEPPPPPQEPDMEAEEARKAAEFEGKERRNEEQHQMGLIEKEEKLTVMQEAAKARLADAKDNRSLMNSKKKTSK